MGAGLCVLFGVINAHATSCHEMALEDRLDKAVLIFTGKAANVSYSLPKSQTFQGDDRYALCGAKIITFEVAETFKGDVKSTHDIFSSDGCLYLGGYFEAGEEYLIFAFDDTVKIARKGQSKTTQFETSVCGGSKALSHPGAQSELKRLRAR